MKGGHGSSYSLLTVTVWLQTNEPSVEHQGADFEK